MNSAHVDKSVLADPCPSLVIERSSDGKGVGSWVPAQKHRLLCEYLDATRYAWAKWSSRIFIDPFCGPGRLQVEGESFTRDGGAVLAWRQLAVAAPFTQMLVGDLDQERVEACSSRLRALGAPVQAFAGAADITVPAMVRAVPNRSLCMAFLDPYNLEDLTFPILGELAALRKVDLAINFSTMDLQRNAQLEFNPQRARFDGTAPGWRDDVDVVRASKQNMPLAFFRYWCELVLGLGFSHSKEMPLVQNDQGRPIYRMVFFARHKLPNRIWAEVARGPNRSLFPD